MDYLSRRVLIRMSNQCASKMNTIYDIVAEDAKDIIRSGRVNLPDTSGRTPIFYADPEATKMLIGAGAIVDFIDKHKRTPLFDALVERTKILLEAGANVNAIDRYGDTPFYYAGKEKRALLLAATTNI